MCAVAWSVACGRLGRLGRLRRLRRLWRGRDESDPGVIHSEIPESSRDGVQPTAIGLVRLGLGVESCGNWELGVSGPSTRCWFRILRCQEDAGLQCFCRARLQTGASRCIQAGSRLRLAESTQVGTGAQVLGARTGGSCHTNHCPGPRLPLHGRRFRRPQDQTCTWKRPMGPACSPTSRRRGRRGGWVLCGCEWLCVVASCIALVRPSSAIKQSNQTKQKQTPKRSALAAVTRASGVWEISVNPAATLTRAAAAATSARVPKPGNTIMQQSGRQVLAPSCACHEIGGFEP